MINLHIQQSQGSQNIQTWVGSESRVKAGAGAAGLTTRAGDGRVGMPSRTLPKTRDAGTRTAKKRRRKKPRMMSPMPILLMLVMVMGTTM